MWVIGIVDGATNGVDVGVGVGVETLDAINAPFLFIHPVAVTVCPTAIPCTYGDGAYTVRLPADTASTKLPFVV